MTHQRPIITRLAVVTLCLCSAALSAAVQRDISSSQTRCAPQAIAHHGGTPTHTNHAEQHR